MRVLGILLCVWPFLATAQNIFEPQYGKPPEEQTSVVWICNIEGEDPQNADQATCSASTKSIAEQACYDSPDTSSCQYLGGFDNSGSGNHTFRARDSDGDYLRNITYSYTIYSQVDTAFLCPPTDFPAYYYRADDQHGIDTCWDPNDLASRDTCPTSGDFSELIPAFNNTAQTLCKRLDDGSACQYTRVEDNNSPPYYQATLENTPCYSDAPELYEGDAVHDDTQQCADIGNGVFACRENPANVCNENGCLTGCGSVTFGGQTEFMCLSGDTDGDGLGDYADPDIDGDGIPNEQDLDSDGDGADDPNYGNSNDSGSVVNINLDETNDILRSIRDSQYTGPDGSQLESDITTLTNDTLQELTDAINGTPTDLGGMAITPTDFTFIDTVIGSLPTASCQNPAFPFIGSFELCSIAPRVNEWLYWILAILTIIAIFHELTKTARNT